MEQGISCYFLTDNEDSITLEVTVISTAKEELECVQLMILELEKRKLRLMLEEHKSNEEAV